MTNRIVAKGFRDGNESLENFKSKKVGSDPSVSTSVILSISPRHKSDSIRKAKKRALKFLIQKVK